MKRWFNKVGVFLSLPFVALFGFFVLTTMYCLNYKSIRKEGYFKCLNEMMNFIYDLWTDVLKGI